MSSATQSLTELLLAARDRSLLVVTGAGVSQASGISTFRGSDPTAIWKQSDVEMATYGYFRRDPVGQWLWYLQRFAAVDSAQPNPAHLAMAAIERWQLNGGGRYLLVTQNIDCLHERAGSQRMVKVHGSSDRVRCSRNGCEHGSPKGSFDRATIAIEEFVREPNRETLPSCPACSAPLRAHVLFFDEYYHDHADYRFSTVQGASQEADLVIFVGTSFSVGVTDLILRAACGRGAPTVSIDPAVPPATLPASVLALQVEAEVLLPEVCAALGVDPV